MESPVVLYIVVSCFIVVLLVVAVRFTLSYLSELREIGADGDTPVNPGSVYDPGPAADPALISSEPRPIVEKSEVARILLAAKDIIVIPGFGMGTSQAHPQVGELAHTLAAKGINVSFAVHPAAGRMPGHMNFLLDEAEVPHAGIFDLNDINERFAGCDLALIIGANDVVNPAARDDVDHPNYGMPVLNADKARQVIVIKRGQGNGYSGIENPLFTRKNVRMIFGDARDTLHNLLDEVKADQDSPPKS